MLTTEWGEALDREHPLPEYPRPQLRREGWMNLNGPWNTPSPAAARSRRSMMAR